jgi:hypothetical protein
MPVDLPGFYRGDRQSIELPDVQRKLIRRLHNMGKKVVMVNNSGSAVALAARKFHLLGRGYPLDACGPRLLPDDGRLVKRRHFCSGCGKNKIIGDCQMDFCL